MTKKLKTRKQLEKYIKENIPFYQWIDLRGYNKEQLRRVIEVDKEKKEIKITVN